MTNLRRLVVFAAAAACALALTGCATTGAPSAATVGDYRDSIELSGRLSVNYQKDGQQESLSGNFNWEQQAEVVDLTLISPLGQTVATIQVTPQQATLTQSGQPARSARHIDALTQETLGWPMPVSGLRDWLQGHAVDASGQPFRASPAHNTVLTRDGWRLRFLAWQDASAAVPVPRRIDAERAASGDIENLTIRIVIDPTH